MATLGWVWMVALTIVAMDVVDVGDGVEVAVSGGVVKGAIKHSRNGRDYHAFHAIPYAQPPIGNNRFMPTLPGAEWSGVLDATQPGEPCAQAAIGIVAGIEDCLNLYVYTPKVPVPGENVSLPVVVWIHGGNFVVGETAALDESLLMDRDIVLVIPQYRLGLLGFFATSHGQSPGNMGMLDQVEALRWVQDNVAAFGGNPNEVTLAGDCSGGASAIYHMISPLSQGLFHRVLSLSGSPLSPWSLYTRNHPFMLILANNVKCPPHDQRLLVQCLQELSQEELLNATQMIIEKAQYSHETTLFLDKHPLVALTNGNFQKVPVLMMENPEFLNILLEMLLKECHISDPAIHKKEFADFYFPGIEFGSLDELLSGLAEMLGDLQYKAGILGTANLLSGHVPTRMFRFEYMGGPKLFSLRYPDPSEAPPMPDAVGHGDEMVLLLPDKPFNYTAQQRMASKTLLDIVENYAYGKPPRADWPLFTTKSQKALVMGADGSLFQDKFTSQERTHMLYNIQTYQNHALFQEMAHEATNHHEL
ncbi:Liver carboxylesterase 2-like [Homarus americanus]|uniref:Liver carboxylesterase 2-like n=1 Tax=Homarus americanus TaxID=6706 RepID=A0A8J5JUG9_HOMAM|nr:Liver carboxylesterase 2-like [Homarus americanus]